MVLIGAMVLGPELSHILGAATSLGEPHAQTDASAPMTYESQQRSRRAYRALQCRHDQWNRWILLGSVCAALPLFITRVALRSRAERAEQEKTSQAKAKVAQSNALLKMIADKRSGMLGELSSDMRRVLENRVEVRHLMTTRCRIVDPETPAEEVQRIMNKLRVHHLMVCHGEKLIGVISDRDLKRENVRYASDIMTRSVISVSPESLLIPTISTLVNKGISCLPVVEDGQLVGVLTRTDVLLAFQCLLQLITKQGVADTDLNSELEYQQVAEDVE